MCNVHLCTWLIDILLFCIWPLHLFGCPAFLLVHCHVALPVSCCPDCLLFSGSSCCILPVYSFVLCSLFVLSVYFSPSSFCTVCLLLSVVLLHCLCTVLLQYSMSSALRSLAACLLFFDLLRVLSVFYSPLAYCLSFVLVLLQYSLSFALRSLAACLLFFDLLLVLSRVGHRVLSRSERSVLSRSFKERSVLSRSFFEFLATYETQKNVKNVPFFCKECKDRPVLI